MDNKENTNLPQELKPKTPPRLVVLALVFVIASYYLGLKQGQKGYVFVPKEFKVENRENQPQNVDYNLLWSAIKIVDQKYIEKPVDPQKVLYGAISGAVAASGDPYTQYFPPKVNESFKTDLAGSFDGIGAEIGKKDGNIVVVAPLDESPAEKAGVLAQDIIVKVNGEDTVTWSVEDAVSKIRGPKGTEVTLTLFRQGRASTFDVKIKRDKIEIKSVKWEIKEAGEQKKKIGVIGISRFGEDTEGLINKAINELLAQGAQGMVIDLRNNPGGYLTTAVNLAGHWVKRGDVVVTEVKSEGVPEVFNSAGTARLAGIKTVVLINGGSASASEILSGALQDYKIAKLIGEKSFGKGSVQELVDLPDGSGVKVTVAKWVLPNGRNLNKDGLVPDIEVKLTEQDIKDGKDPQMEKALEEIVK